MLRGGGFLDVFDRGAKRSHCYAECGGEGKRKNKSGRERKIQCDVAYMWGLE